ncbi:hypothetical protein [Streptomyces sp. NPDC002994]|uniref:hypothetical protein n=1 Tax=Streptomyces sp. NPDC002994 TaxID=3154441 RepID=UPI0033ACF20A
MTRFTRYLASGAVAALAVAGFSLGTALPAQADHRSCIEDYYPMSDDDDPGPTGGQSDEQTAVGQACLAGKLGAHTLCVHTFTSRTSVSEADAIRSCRKAAEEE